MPSDELSGRDEEDVSETFVPLLVSVFSSPPQAAAKPKIAVPRNTAAKNPNIFLFIVLPLYAFIASQIDRKVFL